jgi:hypothetical protein
MKPLQAARFLLELCLIAALVAVGATVGPWLAIVLPVTLAIVWGVLVAPQSSRRLTDPVRLAVELTLFATVGAALAVSGHTAAGLALAISSSVVAVALRRTTPSVSNSPK